MNAAAVDRPPKELLIAAAALAAIIACIFVIVALIYRPPALASPFGCYKMPGGPLMRLSTNSIYIEGELPSPRTATITKSKSGYFVLAEPDFWYVGPPGARRLASLDMLPRWSGLVTVERRKDIPQLSMLVGQSSFEASKIRCPPRHR